MIKANISPKTAISKSIKFKYNMDEFEKNAEKFIDEALRSGRKILVDTAPEFVKAAVKYTPPDIGKGVIDKKRYDRPILDLLKLLRGEYHGLHGTTEDANQFRNHKMKFKVMYTKAGVKKDTAFAYTKTIGQAKKAARIANRGISRVMWGKDLGAIGAQKPVSLQSLLRKSPNIDKHNFNDVTIKTANDSNILEIINRVTQIERYAQIAERMGYKKITSAIFRELKKMADKQVEL